MKLVVFSHKLCWRSKASPTGYATDGGFPFQMRAISELFDSTTLLVPCAEQGNTAGETALGGHEFKVVPLAELHGTFWRRKLNVPFWLLRNLGRIVREFVRADAVHAPIPGDVGTIGMLLAWMFGKRLFVRYCGNWNRIETPAERFWKWFMEHARSQRFVMLATGGAEKPPSSKNPGVRWIFSTSLTKQELDEVGKVRSAPRDGALKMVISCRQEPKKGTEVVIQSLPLLTQRFPGVTLDVIGDGASLKNHIEEAKALGVADKIRFHRQVNHERVMEILGSADLFCFPTTSSEGFSKAVLEALACGLPVISTRVSVLPQLIGTGCGVLLQEATPHHLAKAIEQIFDKPDLYDAMSRQALQTAGDYSLESWRDEIGRHCEAAWGPLKTPKNVRPVLAAT